MRIFLIILGVILVGIGGIGIIVPGLPTTPFLLLAAGLFVKSSPRLHKWLINHKIFGTLIKDYQEKKALPRKIKIFAISMVLVMISLSIFVFIQLIAVKIVVAVLGLTGIIVILSIPSLERIRDHSE